MKNLALIFLIFPVFVAAQDCTCSDNLAWLIKTFSENDAGFQYALDQKGEPAYQSHNQTFTDRAQNMGELQDCWSLLYEWTQFFRSGHIGIQLNNPTQQNSGQAPSTDEIRKLYENAPSLDLDRINFESYLARSTDKSGLEGIWSSGNYDIGIKKEGKEYIGFILKADGIYWQEGQIKLILEKDAENLIARYYMQDHSERIFKNVSLLGNNFLKTDFITWQRLDAKSPTDPAIERYFKLMNTNSPTLEEVSDNSILLRIPSFNYQNKSIIDSLLSHHHHSIINHDNLIIDLRNNGGGSDASYEEIIQYLYTNPIRIVGMEYLSTPLNNARMQQFIDDPQYPEDWHDWARNALKILEANPGKFVNVDSALVDISTRSTIYSSPKQVAVLINENCGSTTEQFLLAAKQSRKVKFFGTTTAGVLDISNQHFVPSPCGEFNLVYCLTKSYRIPDMAIDDKGIQPDYFIDGTIKEYDWIDFALDILEK